MTLILPMIGGRSKVVAAGSGLISQTDVQVDPTNTINYSFSSVNFGAEDADRVVVIGVAARNISSTTNEPAVKIDGGTAITKAVALLSTAPSGLNWCGLYPVAFPTDGANTVTVDFGAGASGSVLRCGIIVWRMIGMSATASDTDSGIITATSISKTLTVPSGGVAIGMAQGTFSSASAPYYTTTNFTKDVDQLIEASVPFVGGSVEASGSLTMTITETFTSTTNGAAVFAAWGP